MITKININLPCKSCYFLVNTEIPITLCIAFKQHFTLVEHSKNSNSWIVITNGNTKLCFCNINFLKGHIEFKILTLTNQIINYVINNNILYICIFDKLLSLSELCYFETLSKTLIKVNNINLINFEFKQILLEIVTGNFCSFRIRSCKCILKKEFTLLCNFIINNYITPYYNIHKYKFPILQHNLLEEFYEILYLYYTERKPFQFSNADLFHSVYNAKRISNISQQYINLNWNNNLTCIVKRSSVYIFGNNQKLYLNCQ